MSNSSTEDELTHSVIATRYFISIAPLIQGENSLRTYSLSIARYMLRTWINNLDCKIRIDYGYGRLHNTSPFRCYFLIEFDDAIEISHEDVTADLMATFTKYQPLICEVGKVVQPIKKLYTFRRTIRE